MCPFAHASRAAIITNIDQVMKILYIVPQPPHGRLKRDG